MDRRDFLKGILAAAVAAQVPMSLSEAGQIAKLLPPELLVNNQAPTGIIDAGNGWYRMWWNLPSPDFIQINTRLNNKTLLYLSTAEGKRGEPVTFSLYAKGGEANKQNICFVQLETR